MKTRLSRLIPAALLVMGIAASALAQELPDRRPARHRFPLCLMVLDLTPEQRVEIHAILQAAWPELRDDIAAIAAARETLRAALDAEPRDACAIGEAAIGVEAALQALRDGKDALKQQLAAVLTPEQLARFEGCLDAPFSDTGLAGSIGEDDRLEIVR